MSEPARHIYYRLRMPNNYLTDRVDMVGATQAMPRVLTDARVALSLARIEQLAECQSHIANTKSEACRQVPSLN